MAVNGTNASVRNFNTKNDTKNKLIINDTIKFEEQQSFKFPDKASIKETAKEITEEVRIRIIETLQDAIGTGEIFKIRYNGGSQPGTMREIMPKKIEGKYLKAYCITSQEFKSFIIDKIEIAYGSEEVNYNIELKGSIEEKFELKCYICNETYTISKNFNNKAEAEEFKQWLYSQDIHYCKRCLKNLKYEEFIESFKEPIKETPKKTEPSAINIPEIILPKVEKNLDFSIPKEYASIFEKYKELWKGLDLKFEFEFKLNNIFAMYEKIEKGTWNKKCSLYLNKECSEYDGSYTYFVNYGNEFDNLYFNDFEEAAELFFIFCHEMVLKNKKVQKRNIDLPIPIKLEYDTFADPRDGKVYKTVKIGYQTWFAENFNYNSPNSKCYENNPKNADKYGRLYNWDDAVQLCPKGWRLPISTDWNELTKFSIILSHKGRLNDIYFLYAGKQLKSKEGWFNTKGVPMGNGIDAFGFSALPGGFCAGNQFVNLGFTGEWWAIPEKKDKKKKKIKKDKKDDEDDNSYEGKENLIPEIIDNKENAPNLGMNYTTNRLTYSRFKKKLLLSVRYIKIENILDKLQYAIVYGEFLEICYYYDLNSAKVLKIIPKKIDNEYLEAYCFANLEIKNFKINKIKKCKVLNNNKKKLLEIFFNFKNKK